MTLAPCPFCGGDAEIVQPGTPRQTCVVACTDCGAQHESSDEGERSGTSWNRRASQRPPAPIRYRNWRGEVRDRKIAPIRVFWGSAPPWHPDPCWLMEARDLDIGEIRTFKLADVLSWDVTSAPVDAPVSESEADPACTACGWLRSEHLPGGGVNNCALRNGVAAGDCAMCAGTCPGGMLHEFRR